MEKIVVTLTFKDMLNTPGSLRDIGELIRREIVRLWKLHEIVELNFDNETVASGSLFDEIAKLFDEYPKEEVKSRLQFRNIDPWDKRLIIHLAKLRLDKKNKTNLT